MKRVFRLLFGAATILSLLLCLMVVGLWVRSYWRADQVVAGYWGYALHPAYTRYYDAWEVDGFSAGGRWTVAVYRRGCVAGPGRYEETPGAKGGRFEVGALEPDRLRRMEVGYGRDRVTDGVLGVRYAWDEGRRKLVGAPHAVVAGMLGVLPGVAMVWWSWRRRGRGEGRCRGCGYDLRATPERCPECGLVAGAVEG